MFFFVLITIFIISTIGVLVMLGYRLWELKTGRSFSSSGEECLIFPVDEFFLRISRTTKHKGLRTMSSVVLRYTHKTARTAIVIAKNNPASRYLTETINVVKGRNSFVKKETRSSFLKAIAAHKEKIRKKR